MGMGYDSGPMNKGDRVIVIVFLLVFAVVLALIVWSVYG